MLRGAEEACWAHNPKVLGSKPSGATFLLYLSGRAATVLWLGHAASSASGLVVKFNVAVVEPRLRFPAGAEFLPFGHIASPVTAMRGGGMMYARRPPHGFVGIPYRDLVAKPAS